MAAQLARRLEADFDAVLLGSVGPSSMLERPPAFNKELDGVLLELERTADRR